ncbi:hypothetical protein Rhow_001988 [Rhodococcus wratislaviensis]|uniref:Uncharacterized protein n=1 Tax=Rhodococcus wratislaviensis TaxID=44752 RepID=A0A402BZ52_RHOWR|nr:hypothetical protein Rhow_001988 [Rhodococcus wratislaviensis]
MSRHNRVNGMNTFREYVTAFGRPAASNPASRTFAADEHRSTRSSPRACNNTVASSTFNVAPSRARRNTRRIADADGAASCADAPDGGAAGTPGMGSIVGRPDSSPEWVTQRSCAIDDGPCHPDSASGGDRYPRG